MPNSTLENNRVKTKCRTATKSERAHPRAQQAATVRTRRHLTGLLGNWTFLRPGTGALRWRLLPGLSRIGALLAFLLWLLAFSPARLFADPIASPPAKTDRGYCYVHDQVNEVPWSIHIFKVARSNRDVEFHTTLGHGNTFGMAVVSQQIRTLSPALGKPLAAINGDFFERNYAYRGRPRDLQIRQGELVSSPDGHPCFWIDPVGDPHLTTVESRFAITWPNGAKTPFGLNEDRENNTAVLYTAAVGTSTLMRGGIDVVLEATTNSAWLPLRVGQSYTARVRETRRAGDATIRGDVLVLSLGSRLVSTLPPIQAGAIVQLSTETSPSLVDVTVAIGGGPTLVKDGQPKRWTGWGGQIRHPRTALGFNRDFIFLVVVDGRQHGLSVGMTFPELATYMTKLGCEQAMNLDGGGSATLWAGGDVMNSPCEGRERPAPNALVVVEKKAAQR